MARREQLFTLELQTWLLPRDGLLFTAAVDPGSALSGAFPTLSPVHQGVLQLPDDGAPVWPTRRPARV